MAPSKSTNHLAILGVTQPIHHTPQPNQAEPPIPTTIKIEGKSITPNSNLTNHFQTILKPQLDNHHWCDPVITPKPQMWTLFLLNKIIFNGEQLCKPSQRAKPMQIALQETNLLWNKIHKRKIQKILQKPSGHAILTTTSSVEISADSHQWGGTLQAIVGSWTSWTIHNGQDNYRMGRWSFIKIQEKMTNNI